jgi:hypothetical protein
VEVEDLNEAEISLHAIIDVTTQFWVLPKLSFSLWNIKKILKKKKIGNLKKTGRKRFQMHEELEFWTKLEAQLYPIIPKIKKIMHIQVWIKWLLDGYA